MKVAVVGTGGVANRHLGVLATLPDCTIVGHVSASLQRALAQSKRWGGHAYDNLALMLERERPEAIAAQLATNALVVGVGYKLRALDTLPRVHDLIDLARVLTPV